jgi:hypothetical protein
MNIKGLIFCSVGVLFVWAITTLFIGLMFAVAYGLTIWIHRFLYKRRYIQWNINKNVKWIFVALAVVISTFETYSAFNPSNSFYLGEFERVTARKAPSSAIVLKKASSYPDMHGDYGSAALIRLSNQDYNKLLIDITNDKEMHSGELMWSEEMSKIMEMQNIDDIEAKFVRTIPGEEDRYLFIGFMKNKATIVVHISVS